MVGHNPYRHLRTEVETKPSPTPAPRAHHNVGCVKPKHAAGSRCSATLVFFQIHQHFEASLKDCSQKLKFQPLEKVFWANASQHNSYGKFHSGKTTGLPPATLDEAFRYHLSQFGVAHSYTTLLLR